ncbi:hypothetical protein CGQ24_06450 [Arthrobacter sp. 7749]|nr:hypothetical protein CGQ24_06450 [Arthrobacter sp. 7749]
MEPVRLKVLSTGTITLALLIGAGFLSGAGAWLVPSVTLVLLAIFALGWPRLLALPAPLPVSLVIFVVSAAATLLGLWGPGGPSLLWVAPGLGVGIILMFLTQLVRGTDAQKRLDSVAVGSAGMLIASCGAGWAVLGAQPGGPTLALMAGIGIMGAAIPAATRLPDRIVFPLGFIVAVLAGGAASLLSDEVSLPVAMVVGALCGLVVVGARAMITSLGGPKSFTQILAAALAPLLVAGSVTWYVLLLLL